MYNARNLKEVREALFREIRHLLGWTTPCRMKGNSICWLAERDGMFAPRRVVITEYSKGVYRLKGGRFADENYHKDVWPFERSAEQKSFELSFCVEDMTEQFAKDVIRFVESSYRKWEQLPEVAGVKIDQSYPGYSWTHAGEALYNASRAAK